LLFDAEARPAYADKFALAVHELRDVIGGSQHVLDDPALYLAVRPYLDPDFTTIPKTILYSGSGRPGDEWKDRLAFEVDATYVDTDDLVAAPDDKIEPLLAARPAVLRDYLTLGYLAEHGGVVLGDRPTILAPIAWALASSRSFFGFKDPTTVSRELFGAVAGAPVVADLLTLFVEHLDDADPLAAAVDEYFLGSGRVAWDYPSIEADFDEPYAELDDSCRVYATSVLSNDFGLGLATASLLPLAVSSVDGARYETTQAYQDIARRIALDYAKWFSTQKKPRPPAAARRTIPADPPPEAPVADKPAPKPAPAPPPPGLRRRLASALFGRRKDPEPEARQPAPPRPEPRPLVVRGDTMRVLLYVGGFTTATSAERARLVTSWLRDTYGTGVDINVLFTNRTSAAPAARAQALTSEGITVMTRAKPPADASEDQEWARVLGGAHFDLLLVATPKGGLAETSLLAAAPSGTRVLCLLGQDLPEPVRDSFDVMLDKLSEFRTWVDDQHGFA
ncbi:MAG TPA: hypothetical protein PKY27_09405, partial [Arachnia sp.]|nr:hypothetical protein [Arachnia sp.]